MLNIATSLIGQHLGSSNNGSDAPSPYITGPLCLLIFYQLGGALFLAKVPDGPQT
jgi:hypothetical protein